MNNKQTPRSELREFVETGRLRNRLSGSPLSSDAEDLLIAVIERYCEPRQKRSTKEPR